jgi:hypothetical protein
VNEQKTIEAYEAALEIEPEDAVALYNNIDALDAGGRRGGDRASLPGLA